MFRRHELRRWFNQALTYSIDLANESSTLPSYNWLGVDLQYDYPNGRHLALSGSLNALSIAYHSALLGIGQGSVGDAAEEARLFLAEIRNSIPPDWDDVRDSLADPMVR